MMSKLYIKKVHLEAKNQGLRF